MSCGVGRRHGSDPMLLWCRSAAVAPIRLLAWELPYAMGTALEKAKRQKKKKRKKKNTGVPVMGQQKRIRLGTMRLQV